MLNALHESVRRHVFQACLIVALAILLLSPVGVFGVKLASFTLEEMVARADVIVLAEVSRIEPTEVVSTSKREGRRYEVALRVDKVIKGHPETTLTLAYYPESGADYSLKEKQQYIFFLNYQRIKFRGTVQAVQRHRGVARIEKDQVVDIAMLYEQPNQTLDGFLARVLSYVRGAGESK